MPEKSLDQIPRQIREQYEKGVLALERNNLDYAITLLTDALVKEPAFYACREALRATQFKRGRSGGFIQKLLGPGHPKLLRAQTLINKNPYEAIRLCEEVLNQDPFNLSAHKILAEAALVADLPKTAILSLEIIAKQHPDDKETAKLLAEALGRIGQWAKAELIISNLVQKFPDDIELNELLKHISAHRTLHEAGYERFANKETSFIELVKDQKEAQILEKESRQYKDEQVQDELLTEYEARIQKEPHNIRLLRAIAEAYAQRKQYDQAIVYYKKIQELEVNDPTIEKALIDLYAAKFDQEIDALNPSTHDYEKRRQELINQKQQFLLERLREQVSRYPHDLHLRFEFGQRLLEAGIIKEAIEQFQKSQSNPHLRIRSLYYLALCFEKRGMLDLAARALQNALQLKSEIDDEKKELLYTLGCVFEKMGRKSEAIEQFKAIYEIDITYRDVAEKVDSYYREKQQHNT